MIDTLVISPSTLRRFVGAEILQNELELASQTDSKYPPHNIIRHGDEDYSIELAVAGFTRDELKISTKNGYLIVTAAHVDKNQENDVQFLHKGIASRDFKFQIKLYGNMHVNNVEYVNGILTIRLKYEIPDYLKEQTYIINQ